MPQQIILRKGTALEWTASGTVVLAAGEPGFETNTGRFKIGNGTTPWTSLSYAVGTIPVNLADLADVTSDTPSSGQVLKWNGSAWAPAADAGGGGTTYSVGAETATGGANLRLTGSDMVTDDVKIDSGTGITVSRTDASTILITNDVVDTTYAISSETATGGANLRLTGSNSSTDDVKLASGTDISVERTDAGTITINSTSGRVQSGLGLDLAFYEIPGTTVKGSNGFLTYDAAGSSLYVEGRVNYKVLGVGKGSVTPNTNGITVSASSQLDLVGPSIRLSGSSISIGGAPGQGRSSLIVTDNGAPVAGGTPVLTLRSYSPSASTLPGLVLQRISSVDGTPTPMLTGDNIYSIRWSGFDGYAPTSTITNISRTAGILTVTTSGSHGMTTSSLGPTSWAVTIVCTTNSSVNLINITTLTVPSSTSFTVTSPGPDITSEAGAGTVTAYNFDVRIAQIKAEATGTISTGIIPGVLKLQVASSSGTMQEVLRLNSDRTARFFNTVAIDGTSNGLRIGSSGGSGGGLITAVGTTINLPGGSTVNGAPIGSIVIKGTVADNTALLALTGMTLGDAYVVLSPSPTHLWSYSGSAWVDLGVFQGPAGTNGQGVPTGGTVGQVLSKIDGTDYNTEWTTVSTVATSGAYADLSGTPTLSTVATTGAYSDLSGTPSIPAAYASTSIDALSDVDTTTSAPTNGQTLVWNSAGSKWLPGTASAGDMVGPASATDNALVRFDGTTGKLSQTSLVTVSDTGAITAPGVGSVIPFYYADQTAFPNATTYHGAIAHSHADGKMYFAHSTTWNALANASDVPAAYSATSINALSDVDTSTAAPSNGQALVWNSVRSNWEPGTVSGGGVTYGISAETVSGGANIRLTGSDTSTDNLTIAAGTNVTVTRTDANTITIASSGGGGSMATRADVIGTTASLADAATGNVAVTGHKSYALLKILVDQPAWVRIYTDTASRSADSSRAEGVDPTPGSGVIAEVITTSAAQTVLISPGTIGFNNEGTPLASIPIAVTNKSGTTRTITVTLTVLQLEA